MQRIRSLKPYLFNGKELDSETGLYYYGARYYDPRVSLWLNVDPLAEKTMTPYAYVNNNPINLIDPDGKLIIFINGQHYGDGGRREYWNKLDNTIANRFKDYRARYYDGSYGGFLNTGLTILSFGLGSNLSYRVRMNVGKNKGYENAARIYASLADGETIKIAIHSMGTAYGKGFVKGLKKYARENKIAHRIERVLDLASFQGSSLEAEKGILTEQIAHTHDGVAGVSRVKGISDKNFHETRKNGDTGWLNEHSVDSFNNEMGIIKEGNPKTGYQSSNNEIKVEYEQRAKKK